MHNTVVMTHCKPHFKIEDKEKSQRNVIHTGNLLGWSNESRIKTEKRISIHFTFSTVCTDSEEQPGGQAFRARCVDSHGALFDHGADIVQVVSEATNR